MRYYRIELSNPDGSPFRVYSSLTKAGVTDRGALNVEVDAPIAAFAAPMGNTGAAVRIWGPALEEIAQSSDLTGAGDPTKAKLVKMFGGMSKGLPLANQKQNGLLFQGFVAQAFGNWIGTNMTLDLLVKSTEGPKNLVLNWRKGTPLQEAITGTLSAAYPGYAVDGSLSGDLVLNYDTPGYHYSMIEFASYVKGISQSIVRTDGYQGVDILLKEKTFTLYDGTKPTTPKEISFLDLIGQPTWIGPATIQVTCVMRGDLNVSDYIKLPQTAVTTTAQSLSQFRDKSVFQGTFQIATVRHAGNFRQPDASSWVTTIDAYPAVAAAA